MNAAGGQTGKGGLRTLHFGETKKMGRDRAADSLNSGKKQMRNALLFFILFEFALHLRPAMVYNKTGAIYS
jgi:hypothetical protein